ncbi:MAG: hypothetical protein Q8S21_06430 [Candidatus Paracaedibacteraceae bacterium]|nr:hypothetical protein [Candidatus Paracaedibacteraceae bacterium]
MNYKNIALLIILHQFFFIKTVLTAGDKTSWLDDANDIHVTSTKLDTYHISDIELSDALDAKDFSESNFAHETTMIEKAIQQTKREQDIFDHIQIHITDGFAPIDDFFPNKKHSFENCRSYDRFLTAQEYLYERFKKAIFENDVTTFDMLMEIKEINFPSESESYEVKYTKELLNYAINPLERNKKLVGAALNCLELTVKPKQINPYFIEKLVRSENLMITAHEIIRLHWLLASRAKEIGIVNAALKDFSYRFSCDLSTSLANERQIHPIHRTV